MTLLTLTAAGILIFAIFAIFARLSIGLGFERGYRAGVEDAAAAIQRDIDRQKTSRESAYISLYGDQIDAGRRREN